MMPTSDVCSSQRKDSCPIDLVVKLLLSTSVPDEVWRPVMQEPFAAEDLIIPGSTDSYPHYRHFVFIAKGSLPKHIQSPENLHSSRPSHNRDVFGKVMFVYATEPTHAWDEVDWLCIGQTKYNPKLFFAYKTNRSGTGFGLGEQSSTFVARSVRELVLYALTEADRTLVASRILPSLDPGI